MTTHKIKHLAPSQQEYLTVEAGDGSWLDQMMQTINKIPNLEAFHLESAKATLQLVVRCSSFKALYFVRNVFGDGAKNCSVAHIWETRLLGRTVPSNDGIWEPIEMVVGLTTWKIDSPRRRTKICFTKKGHLTEAGKFAVMVACGHIQYFGDKMFGIDVTKKHG